MSTSSRQPSDSLAATIAMLTATLMIAQHVASKATRDAFFLTHFAATDLPKAMMGAAVLSILSALTMSRVLTWAGPARVVPGIFFLSAALYVSEWFLALAAPPIAAAVLYLHVAILGALVITGFWSVVNERFDPYAAKKAVGRIVAGATLGGILGGIIAERVAALLDLRAMLLVVGGMHSICALGVLMVAGPRRRVEEKAPPPEAASIGLQPLRESSYLQQMALLMVLTAIVEAFVDYALKAEAAARYSGGDGLVTFFAAFYTITGVATFLFQKTLSPWALRHLGLGRTMALLPGALLIGSVLGSLVTRLWSVVLVRGSEAILSNSAFRSGFELLYTPVAEAKKRSSKAIIDVAGQRVGDFVGGGLVLVLVSLVPTGSNSVIVGAAAIAAAAALVVVYRLHSGYVEQLADSLRRGTISLSRGDILDATTAHTLAESRLAIDREQLLAEIEHYRAQVITETPPSGGAAADDASASARLDSLLESMQVLLSQDRLRVREVLGEERLDLRLVPQLIRLVLQPEVRDDAIGALRKVAPRIIGQLTDHLLDPGQTVLIRTVLPPVLEACDDPRAMEGLLAGLGCEHFTVRFGCAQALARMKQRNPAVSIPSGAILAAVQRELKVGRDVWENQGMLVKLERPDERDWLDSSLRRTVNRSLEHVFTLLALALDLDTVRTVLRGLTSQQASLRGTALEYLENVLPEETREALWPYVCKTPAGRKSKRSREEIVKELHRFRDSLDFD